MLELDKAPVIGRIGPRRDKVDLPFWEGLRQGELRMQQCPSCRTWWWSPVWRCGECGSWDLEWLAVPPVGTVFSWIRTWQPFAPEVAEIVPYVTLLVALPHAGERRLAGLLVGSEDGIAMDASVEGVIQPASDKTSGWPVLRWRLGSGI